MKKLFTFVQNRTLVRYIFFITAIALIFSILLYCNERLSSTSLKDEVKDFLFSKKDNVLLKNINGLYNKDTASLSISKSFYTINVSVKDKLEQTTSSPLSDIVAITSDSTTAECYLVTKDNFDSCKIYSYDPEKQFMEYLCYLGKSLNITHLEIENKNGLWLSGDSSGTSFLKHLVGKTIIPVNLKSGIQQYYFTKKYLCQQTREYIDTTARDSIFISYLKTPHDFLVRLKKEPAADLTFFLDANDIIKEAALPDSIVFSTYNEKLKKFIPFLKRNKEQFSENFPQLWPAIGSDIFINIENWYYLIKTGDPYKILDSTNAENLHLNILDFHRLGGTLLAENADNRLLLVLKNKITDSEFLLDKPGHDHHTFNSGFNEYYTNGNTLLATNDCHRFQSYNSSGKPIDTLLCDFSTGNCKFGYNQNTLLFAFQHQYLGLSIFSCDKKDGRINCYLPERTRLAALTTPFNNLIYDYKLRWDYIITILALLSIIVFTIVYFNFFAKKLSQRQSTKTREEIAPSILENTLGMHNEKLEIIASDQFVKSLEKTIRQLQRIKIESRYLLIVGILIFFIGLVVFAYYLTELHASSEMDGKFWLSMIRASFILLTVEGLSVFFLQRYANLQNEYRYYYRIYLKRSNFLHVMHILKENNVKLDDKNYELLISKLLEDDAPASESSQNVENPLKEIVLELIKKVPSK